MKRTYKIYGNNICRETLTAVSYAAALKQAHRRGYYISAGFEIHEITPDGQTIINNKTW